MCGVRLWPGVRRAGPQGQSPALTPGQRRRRRRLDLRTAPFGSEHRASIGLGSIGAGVALASLGPEGGRTLTSDFQENVRVHASPPQTIRAGQMTHSGISVSKIDRSRRQPLLAPR